jgi:hypothetical protein
MSGRRSHVRFTINGSSPGVLRVLRDVVVQHAEGGGLIALSDEPAVVGERFMVSLPDDAPARTFEARVIDSRPVILNGNVRHRLRLQED